MMIVPSSTAERHLATLFGIGALGQLPDAELLACFASGQGDAVSEASFEAIVARHGPMVLGVCRRILGDAHAAADAFQATFLILARKAPSLRVGESLGPWLHSVSVRVAQRARAVARREGSRVQSLEGFDPPGRTESLDRVQQVDLRSVIDGEILRLPHRYRAVVALCYLEGLSQEQAARRLRCPVGTVQSRLHRARERLRTRFAKRGLNQGTGSFAIVARVEIPPPLAKVSTVSATRLVADTSAGMIPITVSELVRHTLRSMLMAKTCRVGLMLAALAMPATCVVAFANRLDGDEKTNTSSSPNSPQSKSEVRDVRNEPSLADRFAQIRAEYESQQSVLEEALAKAKTQREENEIYSKVSPDEVAFTRRMIALAESSPKEPVARDALIWVLNKPGMGDQGPYGDEFARAAALLLRHHGDDPEAIRIGLQLDNVLTLHRDALLLGFYASAKGHEAKGLARLALAQYLEKKSTFIKSSRKSQGRPKKILHGFRDEEGKTIEKRVESTDEEYSYIMDLRLGDSEATRAEAERLFNEVIADYGDVPFITLKHRELERVLREPSFTWKGQPLTKEHRQTLERMLSAQKTLGQVAEARLGAIHDLVIGKPAPEIDGVDLNGKPLKLSNYRGKVVALVFWASWCGPCLREIPNERELAEKLKDKPFAILGVNCDEDKESALKVVKDERITWPNWRDGAHGEGLIASRYCIRGYPTVFILDEQGIIRHTKALGKSLNETVEKLLQELEAKNAAK